MDASISADSEWNQERRGSDKQGYIRLFQNTKVILPNVQKNLLDKLQILLALVP